MLNIGIHKRGNEILSIGASYYSFIEPQEYCIAEIELDKYPKLEELDCVDIKESLFIGEDGMIYSTKYKIVSQIINQNYVEPVESNEISNES